MTYRKWQIVQQTQGLKLANGTSTLVRKGDRALFVTDDKGDVEVINVIRLASDPIHSWRTADCK